MPPSASSPWSRPSWSPSLSACSADLTPRRWHDMTLLLTHPACLEHQPGPHHPERPERLSAILAKLQEEEFARLQWAEAPLATIEQLTRVHPANYVQAMLGARPEPGEYAMIDGDTILSHGSIDAALRAAGAAVAGVDAVMTSKDRTAFAAVRPPGHH